MLSHIGRFTEQKNHSFLIDVFKYFHENIEKNSVLLLMGDGPLLEKIREKVGRVGLLNSVYFLGSVSNVSDYLAASDIFVFPSLYEGLPLAALEAQASGLPCVLSDSISSDCAVTSGVRFLSLNGNLSMWGQTISSLLSMVCSRQQFYIEFLNSKFNINKSIDILANEFLKI